MMARYYFDIYDDVAVIDGVGQELADLDEARREAVTAISEIAKEILPSDGPAKQLQIKVRDEIDNVVLSAAISFQVRNGG
jgi:hypothetical protein